ncbi:13983_t:CDS:2, partial [Acaulospora colombiana]
TCLVDSPEEKKLSRESKVKDNSNTVQETLPEKVPSVSGESYSSSHSMAYEKSQNWGEDLLRILTKKYRLTGEKGKDEAISSNLNAVINTWNALPRHLNSTWEVYNALHRIGEVRDKIEWLSDEAIARNDIQYGLGNITTNERSYNCVVLQQHIAQNIMVYMNPRAAVSEGEAESGCGAILSKIISGIGITDKRTPLPKWLFIYGIEYTETGFMVRVHFPYYDFQSPKPSWKFASVLCTDTFSRVFKTMNMAKRISALAFLLHIRSHGLLIMNKLLEWERAPEVLVVLQNEALLERGIESSEGDDD